MSGDQLGFEIVEYPTEHVPVPYDRTIQEAFEEFDRTNPHVYVELCRLVDRWVSRGNTKCGIGMLFEILRWRHGMRTGGDEFKLNNNYRSRYVRKLISEHPELANLFELREIHRL